MISPFFAGECTERGSRVKGLRFAPMNAQKRAPLTRLPLRSVCFQPSKKCEKKWEPGQRESRATRHHPLRLRRNEKRTAGKHAASGEHPGFVRCLSGPAFGDERRGDLIRM